MILREWLETRTPAPPPRLLQRIVDFLDADADRETSPYVLLDAAERSLRALAARPTLARDSALDLLAVDALTTYAIECAASPDVLLDVAARAAERLGAIVE